MEWKTHVLTGIVAGYMVTGGDWKGAVVGGVTAFIPDIDEPKSRIGRTLPFISIPLSSFIKHRTITHSFLFSLIIGVAITILTMNFSLGIAATSGVMAHSIGDMLTGKVRVLYPLKKWYGIPVPSALFGVTDKIFRLVFSFFVFILLLIELAKATKIINFTKYVEGVLV